MNHVKQMLDFEHASAQARRFETLFTQHAREYLTPTEPGPVPAANLRESTLRRAAEVAARWQMRSNGRGGPLAASRYFVTFPMMAELMIAHPGLFRPEGRTRVNHDRAHDVGRSIEILARAIGTHLEARAAALADAQGLVERLRLALNHAQGAMAYVEAATRWHPGTSPRHNDLTDNALACYQEARRLAASRPVTQ